MIHLENVSKRYPNQENATLRNISLEVAEGEFVALMGPSGCGKSTLLNIIGAMDTASEGEVVINNLNLPLQNDATLTRFRRNTIGFVFQFFNLISTLTVRENIILPLELIGQALPHQIQEEQNKWLDAVKLRHRAKAFPAELSGGEMQRTAIARALIHKPKLLLADEPTGNLDSENGQQIMSLLRQLCQENGQTVVMATHSEEAAKHFAHRIISIRDGQIVKRSK